MANQNQVFYEDGKRNLLEGFYELIEKHSLRGEKDFSLDSFFSTLSEFDIAYQEFNTRASERSIRILTEDLAKCLRRFFILFKIRGFSHRRIFYAFNKFLAFYRILIENSKNIGADFFFEKNIKVNFPNLWQSDFTELVDNKEFNFNLLKSENYDSYRDVFDEAERLISNDLGIVEGNDLIDHIEAPLIRESKNIVERLERSQNIDFSDSIRQISGKQFTLYHDEYKASKINWNSLTDSFKIEKTAYELYLTLEISHHENNAERMTSTLFKIVSSFSSIRNVRLEFEELTVGSILARIKIHMDNLIAKEETKSVLRTIKEIVVKTLSAGQVSNAEVKKSHAETEKLNVELSKLKGHLDTTPSDTQSELANALNLERQALENERIKIANAKEKLLIIQMVSQLGADGVLEVDSIRIDINEILFFLKNGNQIDSQETDIDEIT